MDGTIDLTSAAVQVALVGALIVFLRQWIERLPWAHPDSDLHAPTLVATQALLQLLLMVGVALLTPHGQIDGPFVLGLLGQWVARVSALHGIVDLSNRAKAASDAKKAAEAALAPATETQNGLPLDPSQMGA